jgi:hypothetical protein
MVTAAKQDKKRKQILNAARQAKYRMKEKEKSTIEENAKKNTERQQKFRAIHEESLTARYLAKKQAKKLVANKLASYKATKKLASYNAANVDAANYKVIHIACYTYS